VAGLHALFRGLMHEGGDLSLIRTDAEAQEILVDGVLPDPVALSELLPTGMRVAYAPNLSRFFATRGLMSVQLRAALSSEDLEQLLQAWERILPASMEPANHPTSRQVTIPNVSILTVGQLLGAGRPMAWRTRLALSHLGLDVEAISRGSATRAAGAAAERREAARRAVRWVGRGELVAELLSHADLIRAGDGARDPIPWEMELLAAIPPGLLGSSLAAMARTAGKPGVVGKERLQRLLLHLAEAALVLDAPGREEGLAAFFRSRAVPLGELPLPLQAFLLTRRLVQRLLADEASTLAQLRKEPDVQESVLGPLVGELIRNDHPHLAAQILSLQMNRPDAAARVQEVVHQQNLVPLLLTRLVTGPRERRAQIAHLCALLGAAAADPLIALLAQSPDRGIRRAACDILCRIGAPALPALAIQLERPDLPWYLLRNLLFIVGTIGQPVPVDIRAFLRHADPRIREEAVQALGRIHGRDAEGAMVSALQDAHPRVRARAVMALASLGSVHARFRQFLLDAVRPKRRTEPEEEEEVLLAVCAAFQRLGDSSAGAAQRMEALLREALAVQSPGALLGLGRGFRAKSPAVQAALQEARRALGSLGAPRR
jgi:HEAT repeat protein